ncbi:MAG: hypothetical protein ABIS50_11530 [Luteolibacter sp.]|uniref:hypothetical protein n=1 Tax=Luteolibacter sp. TaxID=1962973 RepID=UPI0032676DD4
MISRSDAIIPLTPLADHTGLEGYFVLPSGGIVTSATATLPLGVITEGFPVTGKDSVALHNFGGIVKVKLGAAPGAVVAGSSLVLQADGTTKLDPGAGTARIRVARAIEAGVAQELIDAVLVDPAILA